MSETRWWRKMQFGNIKWWGAWGAALTSMFFLYVSLDHYGWKFGLDLYFAASWIWICARFLMLNTIEIEKPCSAIKINGEQVWPSKDVGDMPGRKG